MNKNFTPKELELIEVLKKYGSRANLQKKRGPLYSKLVRSGRTDILDAALSPLLKTWTLELCQESAKKYKTRGEWETKDKKAYKAALRKGWLEQCCSHMESQRTDWTLEMCKKSAKKYKTRSEWLVKDNKAYQAARKKGWLEQCCGHMSKNAKLRPIYCFETKKTYASTSEAARTLKINGSHIATQIKGKVKTVGGYTFKYADT
jgi:hypothetical protein